jgi:hypothetical protein
MTRRRPILAACVFVVALPGQPHFGLGYQRSGSALSPMVGMNGQPINVGSPAVERSNDRTDDSAPCLGHEYDGGAVCNGPSQVFGGVSDAGSGTGLTPKFEDRPDILHSGITDEHAAASSISHRSLGSMRTSAWSAL